jgi:transposase
VLNKTYYEMAEHYGTAVIPTRVRAPKDKATVEGTVGIVSTHILAALRNEKFFSLYELNKAIKVKLAAFNNKPFVKKDGSRFALFAEERGYLLPLPEYPFEFSEWKTATVQYNYHVSVELMNYSVPFEYIKKRVDVRLTRACVEVFYEGVRIASHRRLHGRPGQYATAEEHMPESHKEYAKWNGARFREWAAKIGEKTLVVINALLTCNRVEQQGYKSCMSILKLSEQYSKSRLEAACIKALSFTPRPGYKQILNILKSGDVAAPAVTATKQGAFSFVRGADYYKGGNR